ncbi:MAG TPA: histidine kinase [Burkholderiales bacterium]|jgi:two-component system sensor histidine kinase AlgZ
MASIRQNPQADALPDFRNLGVTARVLIVVNLLAAVAALLAERDWTRTLAVFVGNAALLEPPLVASLVVLYAASPRLVRMPYWQGSAVVIALVLALAAGTHALFAEFAAASLLRTLVLAGTCAAVVLIYLRLHMKAYSPALAEARLQALQARIRPHFLFNSLNAVLGLIRRDPKRAEQTLEDLSDLFRALMSDGRSLVRLADEIALIERYAAIEQLRLGERLRMSWELDNAPMDAMLPPLVLQPLVENAIYHGVEPGTGIGDVMVRIERRGDRVLAAIENPWHAAGAGGRAGNHMALDNIRERLMLFFDDEARLDSRVEGARYRVEIEIPYRGRG